MPSPVCSPVCSALPAAVATAVVAAEKSLVVGSATLPAKVAWPAAYGAIALIAMSVHQVAASTTYQCRCNAHQQHHSLHQRVPFFAWDGWPQVRPRPQSGSTDMQSEKSLRLLYPEPPSDAWMTHLDQPMGKCWQRRRFQPVLLVLQSCCHLQPSGTFCRNERSQQHQDQPDGDGTQEETRPEGKCDVMAQDHIGRQADGVLN